MSFRYSDQASALRRAADLYARTSFDLAVRQLHAQTLLKELNAPAVEQVAFRFRRGDLRAAAYLLRSTALSLRADDAEEAQTRGRYLRRSAEIFERLSANSASERGRFEALSQAAACWSLAGYAANSVVLGRRIRAAFPALGQGGPSEADYYSLTGAILERDVPRLRRFNLERQETLNRFEDWAIERLAMDDDAETSRALAAEVVLLAELWAAGPDLLDFWRRGEGAAARRALGQLRSVEQELARIGQPDEWLMVESARLVFEESVRNSTWHLLRRYAPSWSGLWARYASRLARQTPPVVELWPSQRRALEAGALNQTQSSLVIRTPTSSGKTRVAEMAILASLNHRRGSAAVYLVPFRALASEVEGVLSASLGQLGFQVSSLFGGYETSELEDFLLLQSDVLIVTPEKLDLLIRQAPEFLERLGTVVVDEGHLVGEPGRGLRLELLLTRIRSKAPNVRVLFLSAVMPNGIDVAKWLDPATPHLLNEQWKPTEVLTGVFSWSRDRGRVDYVGHSDFFVPFVIQRSLVSKGLTPKTRVPRKPQPYPVEIAETAAELALHYQGLGPLIIYAATKPNATAVARRLKTALSLRRTNGRSFELIGEDQRRRNADIQKLAVELLDSDHELVDYLGEGFAFHHALVPEQLRARIEAAFRSGDLQILVCTSTLTQGVNLPVKTVIVSHYRIGRDPIRARDFWNVAGRAGRANRETEGQVILIASPTRDPLTVATERKYLGGQIEPVPSALAVMIDSLIRKRIPGIRLRILPADAEIPDQAAADEDPNGEAALAFDAQLLALVCEEVVGTEDEDDAAALLGATLAGVQIRDIDVDLAPIARWLRRRAIAVAQLVPDRDARQAFYRTGLSITSCQRLLAFVDEYVPQLANWSAEGDWSAARDGLLPAAFVPDETALPDDVTSDIAVRMLGQWMSGASVEELRDEFSGLVPSFADPMEFNDFVQRFFVNAAPWALSSALQLLRFRLGAEDLPDELTIIPALAKYGVPTAEASFVSALGIATRDLASIVGDEFGRTGASGFPSFLKWFAELQVDEFRSMTDDESQAQLLARRASRITPNASSIDFLLGVFGEAEMAVRGLKFEGRGATLGQLTVGGQLVLQVEPENAFDDNAVRVLTQDQQMLGYVPREFAPAISAMLDNDEPIEVTVTTIGHAPSVLRMLVHRSG